MNVKQKGLAFETITFDTIVMFEESKNQVPATQSLMKSSDVVDLYELCQQNEITIWIDGGWAVDALLGKQIRDHNDVDIAIEWKQVSKLRKLLEAKEYRETAQDGQFNFVMTDRAGKTIDFHAFILDTEGNIKEGIEYPKGSLTGSGVINDKVINCIAPTYMVQFIAPWISKHPSKYLPAVSALCEKYNIPLPEEYLKYKENI